MIVRHWAEFSSDLPTDEIEGPEGFTQYGGKSVICAVADMLARTGHAVDTHRNTSTNTVGI